VIGSTTSLGDVVTILSGFAFKSQRFNNEGRGLPLVRIRDVVPGKSNTFYDGDYDPQFEVRDGDLLIGMDGEFNRARWSGGRSLLNQRVCRVSSASSRLDDRFLYWLLPNVLKAIEDRTPFVTVKHLSSRDLKGYPITLPSLDEQRRIAAILDQADALRRKRRTAVEQSSRLTQTIFAEMFGDWSRPGNDIRLTELGPHLKFLTSGSRGWASHYSDSGKLFLRIQNVRYDKLDLSDVAFVAPPNTAESRRTKVQAGDVLLSITADLGRTAVVPEDLGDAHINQHLSILRSDDFEPRYLSAALASPPSQRSIRSKNREGVKAGLNFDDVKSLEIPDAPREQQRSFAKRAAAVDRILDREGEAIKGLDSLFASLQKSLFAGSK
jgi:type I restriction enzyme S subunit